MSLALLFHYLMLNMFRMLVQPFSGACDLFVELFHGLYCPGLMCRKLLRMDVLTSETCWALNNEIIKQVTSCWSIFIQVSNMLYACTILSSVACPTLQNFSTLSNKRQDFREKKILNTKCIFRFSPQYLSDTSLILIRNERDMIKNVYQSTCKVFVILVRFLIFSTDIRKIIKYRISWRSV